MRRAELIGAAVVFLLGAHVVQQSIQLEYWAKFGPGPGFMPFWIGILWMVLSTLHIGNVIIQPRLYRGPQPFPTGEGALRLGATFGILLVSVFLIGILGFVTSLVIMIGVMLKGIERMSWRKTVIASVAIAAACYLIFAVAIGVLLPTGPLGI